MGTHPIFESDFDCLTDMNTITRKLGALAVSGGAVGSFLVAVDAHADGLRKNAKASGGEVHPPAWPFEFELSDKMYDAQALRRGWHVYKNVCKTCHSMEFMWFREMIGHSHTEEEVKAIAAEFETVDEDPDEEGNDVMRPCLTREKVPKPYANAAAARAANGGALPPDLSLICLAREGGTNYIYSLLNGYCDAPAGVTVGEGMNFNPYFPGGGIGMAQPIYNETVDYAEMGDKDTKPYQSQISKDIVTFLRWVCEPAREDLKLKWYKTLMLCPPVLAMIWLWKQRVWSGLKSTKMTKAEDLRKFK